MAKFDIWREGWRATGERAKAELVATVEAESFREACIKHYGNDRDFNANSLTYWGCTLHDNEADARKVFG